MRSLRNVLPAFFLVACGLRRDQVVATLDRRDLGAAQQLHDDALGGPNGSLPASQGWLTGLLLLDRAMLRAARSDFAGASGDFAAADKIVDSDDILRTKRMRILNQPAASRYMYQRGWGQAINMPIGLKFHERLLVNPFAALSRLQANDPRGACVEARRFGVIDESTDAIARGRARDVRRFGELVSAIACDAGDDDSLACASWTRAGVNANDAVLHRRCAHEAVDPSTTAESDLWVFVAYGRASHPETNGDGSPIASLVGGRETETATDLAVAIDGRQVATRDAVDIEAAVRADYTESQTALELTVLGMKGRAGQWSPVAWTVMPAHVGIARATVKEGTHAVRVRVRGEIAERTIRVARGEPGVAFVYVPW